MIGQLLIYNNLLNEEKLDYALKLQKQQPNYLGYILVKHGLININLFQEFLKNNPSNEESKLLEKGVSKEIIKKISSNVAWYYHVAPLCENDNNLIVGFSYLPDETLLNSLSQITSKLIKPIICSRKVIYSVITKYFPLEYDKGTILPIELEMGSFTILNDNEKIVPKNITSLKIQDTASEWLRSILADSIKNKAKRILLLELNKVNVLQTYILTLDFAL